MSAAVCNGCGRNAAGVKCYYLISMGRGPDRFTIESPVMISCAKCIDLIKHFTGNFEALVADHRRRVAIIRKELRGQSSAASRRKKKPVARKR